MKILKEKPITVNKSICKSCIQTDLDDDDNKYIRLMYINLDGSISKTWLKTIKMQDDYYARQDRVDGVEKDLLEQSYLLLIRELKIKQLKEKINGKI